MVELIFASSPSDFDCPAALRSISRRGRLDRTPQIESQRIIRVDFNRWYRLPTWSMADWEKSRYSPAFRFVRIYRKEFEIAASRMGHVPATAADRALIPHINQIKYEWRMCRNRGMQAG